MRIIYIAHPISGDVEANLNDLRRIVRIINLKYADIVPFVPYYCDVVSLCDSVDIERKRGMRNNETLLKSNIVSELWLTGDRISNGMRIECEIATTMRITILDLTNLI